MEMFRIFFTIRKGCKTGLSALQFILSIEILACKIRQSKNIEDIKLPLSEYCKNEVRVSLYADDITIFVKDETYFTY